MANAEHIVSIGSGYVAGSDLSNSKGRAVRISPSGANKGQVVLAPNNSKSTLGILVNQPKTGEACVIAGPGSRVQVEGDGGTNDITTGDNVGPSGSGAGSGKITKKATANDIAIGVALEDCTEDNTPFLVALTGLTQISA